MSLVPLSRWYRGINNKHFVEKRLIAEGNLRKGNFSMGHWNESPIKDAWVSFVSVPSWLVQLDASLIPCSFRGYYVVVVPLKKQRGGKFLNPWEDPDQMNLDEVRRAADITQCPVTKAG